MPVAAHVNSVQSMARSAPAPRIPAEDDNQLLEILLGELLNSAYLTAMTARTANALSREIAPANAAGILSCLPPSPKAYADARFRLHDFADALPVALALSDYYGRLPSGRDAVLNWARNQAHQLKTEHEHVEILAEEWRRLASSGRKAVEQLTSRVSGRARQQLACRADLALRLLSEATEDAPKLSNVGGRLPIWVDRRNSARRFRGLQACLKVADGLHRVGVLDSSADGIGVVGIRDVVAGSRVELLVKPGHGIGGTVIWVMETRAGIRLDEPLPPDSQLLNQLQQGASLDT